MIDDAPKEAGDATLSAMKRKSADKAPKSSDKMKLMRVSGSDNDDDHLMDWELPSAVKDDQDSDCFSFESINDDLDLGMEVASSFDIKVLQKSIESSAKALEMVRGKDVVMVVGKTGVGKSTLLQGIAGKKIETSVYEATFTGDKALKQVYDVKDTMAGFEIGHDAKSMTSHLSAFLRSDDNSETVYLDSPGMEDTNGVEMDIATSALFSQVAKRCRSLKFIVVIHCASLLEDRGGAFRSVLKFARRFVADFNQHKKSFMFLFSHTNEISEMSDSVDKAKKRLRDDIIRTAQGTTDKDVLAVLQFIRQSLDKDYPFAGIYRPLEMSFSLLASNVEGKLKKMTELTLASSCNLTTASNLKLDGAVQTLIQRLRVSLRNSSPDPATVKEISDTLYYIGKYVEVDCVRKAAEEVKVIMDEHIDATKTYIESQVLRGLHSDTEFSVENARLIKDSLALLKEIDKSFMIENWHRYIMKRLIEFKQDILRELICSSSFQANAKKMAIWAKEFCEYSDLYTDLCTAVMQQVQALAKKMSETDVSKMDQGSQYEILHFIRSYSQFYEFCERALQFPVEGVAMDDFVAVRDATTQRLTQLIETWCSNILKLAPENLLRLVNGKHSLQLIAVRARAVEIIEDVLKKQAFVCSVLLNKAKSVKKDIENHVTGWYTTCCSSLKEMGVHSKLESFITWMHDASQLFGCLNGERWKSIPAAYLSLIERSKDSIVASAQDLASRCKIARQNGIVDGKQLAKELNNLKGFIWIDIMVDSGHGSIFGFCSDIDTTISSRIQEKRRQLDGLINDLEPNSALPCSHTVESLGHLLPELREIDCFKLSLHPLAEWDPLSKKCISSLEDVGSVLCASGGKYLENWADGFKHGRSGHMRTISRKLNSYLYQLRALESTKASDHLMRSCANAASFVRDVFQKCKNAIKAEFSSFDGNIQSKVAFLASIQACQESTFVASQLPELSKLQHHLRVLISVEAQEIESLIEQTSDWDGIDSRLESFRSALDLDSYVDNEVSRRLHSLQRLREQKEDVVEDFVHDMIRVWKFEQISEFIAPLASSKDQIKKQKFSAYQSEIAVGLEEIINQLHRLLDPHSSPEQNADDISQNLDVLMSAESELQELLLPRLDVFKEVSQLKSKANAVMECFLENILQSVESLDLVQMFISRRKANDFNQSMRKHFCSETSKSLEGARKKVKAKLDEIKSSVRCFFDGNFRDPDVLAKAMSSLKDSTERQEQYFETLHRLYDTLKRDIDARSRQVMNEASEVAQKHRLFDDVVPVMHSLNCNLQGPLKGHCSQNLLNECNQLVESLRQEKEKHDRWFEFDSKSGKEKIEEWSKRMDALESRPWTLSGYISRMWSRENATYETYRLRLLRMVNLKFSQGLDALKTRDAQAFQECMDILECVAEHAKKHVTIAAKKVKELRSAGVETFLKLCKRAEQIIQSESPLQIEELFFDYHAFSTKIPCILQSDDGQKGFSLVHQLLFELFEHKVALLRQAASTHVIDFSVLRLHVVDARTFGNFLADNLTLLHEETKDCVKDKWLEKVVELCWRHCSAGRDLGCIKYCSILGVVPSATETEIKRAFKEKALLHHPDKDCGSDGATFLAIKDAYERLLAARHLSQSNPSRPFDNILIELGEHLRRVSKKLMQEQQYDIVEKMLFQLPNIKGVANLVTPALECDEITECVYKTVKDAVEKSRIEMDSNWNERRYKELNDTISDLKLMEIHFSSYPQIFSSCWDKGITKSIEAEIELLGEKGSLYLESHLMAKQKMSDFRRIFIDMGFVLVELPLMKAFTKRVMSDVLEKCLDTEWGYGFLFEVGLSLQKGDDSYSDDENRVAQMLITEFSHFKEVQTMV
jgi:energy-coupling factor transporter ATP-binding protein EcfA2